MGAAIDCQIFKLFLILLWENREQGLDWDEAEQLAWAEAENYYLNKTVG